MNHAFLLLGGNMGNREQNLAQARSLIANACGTVVQQSSVYETAAWGLEAQDAFLNGVIEVETSFTADALLKTILSIEESLGRKREVKYGPRIIDIDILFFNHDVVQSKQLTVPHPQLQHRRFVLVPLAQIAPDFIHPVLRKSVAQLLAECVDPLAVQKFR